MLSPDAGDGGDGDHGPERVLADPVAELATELWMVMQGRRAS